jgi:hypothetical protein
MFPKIEESELDLEALGRRLALAKQRLMGGRTPARRGTARKGAAKRPAAARRAKRKAPTRRSRRA